MPDKKQPSDAEIAEKIKKGELKGSKEIPNLGNESREAPYKAINLVDPTPTIPGIRINVGCGNDYREGFINIDPYDDAADIKAPIQKLPFETGRVAQIICFETLEHIPQADVQPALNECFRVLKKGGQLVMTVPDMVGACQRFLEDPENEWSIARIYGNQSHPGQFHMAGFTPKMLFRYLGYAGFRGIGVAYFDEENGVRNMYVEAQK